MNSSCFIHQGHCAKLPPLIDFTLSKGHWLKHTWMWILQWVLIVESNGVTNWIRLAGRTSGDSSKERLAVGLWPSTWPPWPWPLSQSCL